MAKVKFELYLPGLNELMKSPEMKDILLDAAEQMADFCNANASPRIKGANEGYAAMMPKDINYISISQVRAFTFPARLDNSRHNTLEKSKASVKI